MTDNSLIYSVSLCQLSLSLFCYLVVLQAAANSPSADKNATKLGSQKVPPLTIKLGAKAPASAPPTASSSAQPGSVVESFTSEQDKDMEVERASSAPVKGRH